MEDSIRTFLQTDLFGAYDPLIISMAVAERVASSKGDDKAKKKKKAGDPTMPTEPKVPKDDKKKNKEKWDQYEADKQAFLLWRLGKARRASIEVGAEIVYPEDLQYLVPISEKTSKPLKIVIAKVPADTSKAWWTDELKQATGPPLDFRARKDKNIVKKSKGLSDRCYDACQEDLVPKLMTLSRSDKAIWEGCAAAPKKKSDGKEPAEPKPPKNLVNPYEMFKEGKNAGKYEDFDSDGIPKSSVTKKGSAELTEKQINALRKQWDKEKVGWDKHQEAMKQYNAEMKKLKDLESGGEVEDDFGVPEDQKEESCKTAAKSLVARLVEELIVKRAEELAAEVNKGLHDPDDLKALVVEEKLEEVEIITDPVLKAFRRFDEAATNSCSVDQLTPLFRALGDDELGQGTHVFYNDVTDAELDWTRTKLASAGVEQDGSITYTGIKTFIEAQDVSVLAGSAPANLVSCLMVMKIESRLSSLGSSLRTPWSPRTWRAKLDAEFGGSGSPKGAASPRSGQKKATKTDPKKGKGATSPKEAAKEEEEGAASPKEAAHAHKAAKKTTKTAGKHHEADKGDAGAAEKKDTKKKDADKDKKEKKDKKSKK